MKKVLQFLSSDRSADAPAPGLTRRGVLCLALLGGALALGDGPGWVMKSRGLTASEVWKEIFDWVTASWNDVLPIVVVAAVLGGVAAGLKASRGHHEAQGQLGRIVLALIAALFATGIIG